VIWVTAFGIGFVAGLRSMTAPAAVALVKHASLFGPIFVVAAVLEDLVDKHPKMPSRLRLPSIVIRPLSGALCAFFLVGGFLAAIVGVAGAFAGSFVGAAYRRWWVDTTKLPDWLGAILEDLASIALAFAVVTRPV
jgi:uncharacterized membrane protein